MTGEARACSAHLPQAFRALGTSLEQHVEIRRVEPAAYRVWFGDGSHLDLLNNHDAMAQQLEGVEAGAGGCCARWGVLQRRSSAVRARPGAVTGCCVRHGKKFWKGWSPTPARPAGAGDGFWRFLRMARASLEMGVRWAAGSVLGVAGRAGGRVQQWAPLQRAVAEAAVPLRWREVG